MLKSFLKKGQVLVDAFCGVGPLSIRSAKNGLIVYANDLNPDCYFHLKKNVILNKIKNNFSAFNMDAREFIKGMFDASEKFPNEDKNFDFIFPKNIKIDHIYMNLPKDAIEFLDVYSEIISTSNNIYTKDNLPIIHVYGFSNSADAKQDLLDRCAEAMKIKEFPINFLIDFTNVRDVSPKKYMFSISFKLPPEVAFK